MTGKILFQLFILVGSFFGLWFGLQQFDWMKILHVREVTETTEEKLGKLYWDLISKMEEEATSDEIISPVDSLLTHLCRKNDIDRDNVKLHIMRKDDVNAFALPDHHLVLLTGLIADCENEAELAGVIAHELAHMEEGHIMKKLVKEIGLSILIGMTAGKGGPEVIQEAVRILSSTAYDRNLEREADIRGVDYLINAGIDPESFANFLFRMSSGEKDLPDQIWWISTHPGSEERTQGILDYIEGKELKSEEVLDRVEWDRLKEGVAK